MNTRLSTKGIRRRLGLRAGDVLEARVQGGRVVLIPPKRRSGKASLRVDPITGLPVLSAGGDAPVLSSKQVREILAEFP
jgi:bifunctional DNA-binding transcriptional regulator/antitoxin component of YhaV-PrlF toxin-antitoxin module